MLVREEDSAPALQGVGGARAALGEVRRGPAEVRVLSGGATDGLERRSRSANGDRCRGRREVRRGGYGCTGHETRWRRAEKQEGSEAELGEELVTCRCAQRSPTNSDGCCGLVASGGGAGGAGRLQARSGGVNGGAVEVWEATADPLLLSTRSWP